MNETEACAGLSDAVERGVRNHWDVDTNVRANTSVSLTKVTSTLLFLCVSALAHADCVVLLHGLALTSRSMEPMDVSLRKEGYRVANIDYPSRGYPVEELSLRAIDAGLEECALESDERIHFVTHSMGGILVRYYLTKQTIDKLGRVVMLAPPNGGSEVVDKLKDVPGFRLVNGPAGVQLGTGAEDIPAKLGRVTYPVGVIAGTRTVNPILSQYLPNPDDGKVSIESAKVEGMTDFIAIQATHPFIMRNKSAIAQTIKFLRSGAFEHGTP